MHNDIKTKASGVHKRNIVLVFLLAISMNTMVACDSDTQEFEFYKEERKQETPQEFELVSVYIEYRNITNKFGGVVRTDEYIHYGYVDENGQVIFDEMYLKKDDICFQVTEGTPKIIITTSPETYAFYLTREMYSNLNSSQ